MFFKKLLFSTAFILIATIISIAGYLFFAKQQPALAQTVGKTYYIDYEMGNDFNDGLSEATAWKHSPGDPNAIGSADIILSAGDIIVFKGGATYSFNLAINDVIEANASGSADNLITYRSGHIHSPQWGTGRAVIDCANANVEYTARTGCLDLNNFSYIKVEGLEIKNQSINDATTGLIAWKGKTGGNIIIDNNYLHTSNSSAIWIQGAWSGERPRDFTITNNIGNASFGHLVTLRYALDTVLVEGNVLDKAGNNPYGVLDPLPAGNCIAVAWYDGTYASTNYIIRNNDLNDTSIAPNKSLILLQQSVNNLLIEKNYFHGTPAYSGIDIIGNYDNLTIRNNVFHVFPAIWRGVLSFSAGMSSGYGFSNNVKIHNNTFISTPKNDAIIFFNRGTNSAPAPHFTNIDIKNNIFDFTAGDYTYSNLIYAGTDTGGVNPVVQLSSFTSDYNIYNWGTRPNSFVWGASGQTNFASWKTMTGQDTHSSNAAVAFKNLASDDFNLNSVDISAKDKGISLSSFAADKDGVLRPQGSAWDIGAYEYIQTPPPFKGDFNSDQKVNNLDFTSFKNAFKSIFNSLFDLNSDSTIDVKDLGVLMSGWLE